MTVEGIIAETLDLAAMRQQWTQDAPRLRQGMRVLAYQPLSDSYHNLHTLDQAYYTPPQAEEPAQPAQPVTGAPPPAAPPSAEPASPPEEAETDDASLQRRLDLSGTSQTGGFNLLASPFNHDEAEKDQE
jgi:hypothetical protein